MFEVLLSSCVFIPPPPLKFGQDSFIIFIPIIIIFFENKDFHGVVVTLCSHCSFVVAVCLFMLLILVVAVREFGTNSSPAGFGWFVY